MLGIIIQARLKSSRLFEKIILPFYQDKGILELVIESLKNTFSQYPIILATTKNPIDSKLAEIGTNLGINVFRGDENNVLKRFINAGERYGLHKIIRVCADNPFLYMKDLSVLISTFEKDEVDYMSFKTSNNVPIIKSHFGLWSEAVRLNALKKIITLTDKPFFLEHVTNYIYSNSQLFNQKYLPIPIAIEASEIRLTVDTKTDFEVTKEIYAALMSTKITDILEMTAFIKKNKNWTEKMKTQINLNSK